jgi:alpha-L-arabinofuranosidase
MLLSQRLFQGLIGYVIALSFSAGINVKAQTNFSLYSDQLNNGFQNWSWGANNFSSAAPVHSGTNAISFSGAVWQAISFWHQDFNPAPYTYLTFWANGGSTGGQILQVYLQFGASNGPSYQLSPLPTNSWKQFNLPLGTLGVAGITNLNRLNFQLTSYGQTNSFSLDDVNLAATMPSPIHVNVNASQTLRAADARWFGLNTAIWDGYFDTTSTSNALSELGTSILRFPGGSLSDEYHWATGKSGTNTWAWGTTFNNFVHIATNAGVQAMITVNYGTGTPQEAAAWVRHANFTNHFNFKNWEIGNECYGTWETDTNVNPHDPYTYAVRAAQYIAQMKTADATIKIGLPVVTGEDSSANGYTSHPIYNSRTGTTHYGWTPVVLATLKSLGVTPDFLVHHVYPQYQNDSDQTLLQASANWANDAADLRQQITDYFGTAGTNLEILCTENNADAGNQGRQSTSIVNGLYLADSLAQLMKTEINAFIWWDLRNGSDTAGDFNSLLYGWRNNGDLGIIGGSNTRYPVFYSFKLMQYLARPGDTVLNATSDYFLLSTYAARKANGALSLLVINKDSTANLAAQIRSPTFSRGPPPPSAPTASRRTKPRAPMAPPPRRTSPPTPWPVLAPISPPRSRRIH